MPSTATDVPSRGGAAPALAAAAAKTFIKHWLGRYERCRSCGIQWHREHGFELGPIALNVVFTFGSARRSLMIDRRSSSPPPTTTCLRSCRWWSVPPSCCRSLVYPFTYTLWLAFDLAGHQPDERELRRGRRGSRRVATVLRR